MVVMCKVNPKTNMPPFITLRLHEDFKLIHEELCTIPKDPHPPKNNKRIKVTSFIYLCQTIIHKRQLVKFKSTIYNKRFLLSRDCEKKI